jgi:sterol 3beta-glucosyltransferase
VHHGGAGTTAAGLEAGKPAIICPFFGDQPFWGQRVFELGVGPKPIPQKQLTAESLSTAIREVTTNREMIRKSAELGHKIRSEDGVVQAVQFIEKRAGL